MTNEKERNKQFELAKELIKSELKSNGDGYIRTKIHISDIAWLMVAFAEKKTIKDVLDVLEFMAAD